MEKSASSAESHVCERRQKYNLAMGHTAAPASTGEVQRHLKNFRNRRAVQDTARKKQKSLRSNALFHTAARKVL